MKIGKREALSITLGVVSICMFYTGMLTDAIYLLGMAIWVEPKGGKKA